MGCDGGTIPTRDELVKLKKKPEQKAKYAELAALWKLCAITQQPLVPPIVACELGKLYMKESVIEFLLDKSKFEGVSGLSHIRGLKDIKELGLTDNPAFKPGVADKGDAFKDNWISPYICPISGLEMNGRHKFCFLYNCGCVLSERALKEIPGDTCIKCNKALQREDVVILNPVEADLDLMEQRMDERRAKAKLEKKAKRKQKAEAAEGCADDATVPKKSKSSTAEASTSTVANGTTSSGQLNGTAAKGKSKLIGLTSNGTSKLAKSKPKSVQDDPSASKVFKSLFTTSEKARNQPTAHWVTYNPQYN